VNRTISRPGIDKSIKRTYRGGEEKKKKKRSALGKLGRGIIKTCFGFRIGKKHIEEVEGYTMKYDNKTGRGYLAPIQGEEDDIEAINEHVRKALSVPFCSSISKIAEIFGIGIFLYFDFIFYINVSHVLLTIATLVNVIYHLMNYTIDPSLNYQNFFVSAYNRKTREVWLFTTFVCIFIMFIYGPILSCRLKGKFRSLGYVDHEDQFFVNELDVIRKKKWTASKSKNIKQMSFGY